MGGSRSLSAPLVLVLGVLVAFAAGLLAASIVPPARPGNTPPLATVPPDVRTAVLGGARFTAIAPPDRIPKVSRRWVDNHNSRPGGIKPYAIVMHATGSGQPGSEFRNLRALGRHFDGRVEVSAHYGIDRKGRVMQYVPDDRRAWHTAAAGWNDASIGIELLNDNTGEQPFPRAQVVATRRLVQALAQRHEIPLEYVVRHRDIQWWDRSDPARNFEWQPFRRSLRHTG